MRLICGNKELQILLIGFIILPLRIVLKGLINEI